MLVISKLKKEDIPSVADLHQKGFDNFFLTSLGDNFLHKFYFSIIKSNKSIAIGAFDENGNLVGFAVGAKTKKGFYKELMKSNFFPLLSSAAYRLFADPTKIWRLANSFFTKESSNEDYLESSTLLSICVDPQKKGLKIGKCLLHSFETEAKNYSDLITLTTDALDNNYVNSFYVSNKYVISNYFKQGNREMNLYFKKIK